MASQFSLAGLLRLRHAQEDQAAGNLAAANLKRAQNAQSESKTRTALGGTPSDATSTEALHALAAARASTRSMLADLAALGRQHEAAARNAQLAFDSARKQSLSLEKLEIKHNDAVTADELKAEQLILNEIATTSWHRDSSGGAS